MSTMSPDDACPPSQPPVALNPRILPDDLPPEDVFTRAFWDLKPIADALPPDRVRIARGDSELAYVNAKNGFALIEAHLVTARAMPNLDFEALQRVPNAALGLLGATHRLNLLVVARKELPEKLLQGRKLRKVLLSVAEAGVGLEAIPEEPVAHIRKGSSSLDAARDLIELSILLREHEPALRDKLSIAPSILAEAAELGTWLRDAMQPSNAPARPKSTPAEIKQATDDRNRMWTLLAEGYAELQRVATFLGLDVPSLQSRRGLRKKVKAEADG